jgi:Sulfotransferase family
MPRAMDDSRQVVFIIGVGRSGTTAMVDLLNLHPAIAIGIERYKLKFLRRGAFEGDEFTAARFFDFRPGDTNILPEKADRWAKVYRRLGRKFPQVAVVGDKIPHLFERFEECERAFPGARWVYMLRDINGVACSWNARARNPEDRWPAKNDFREAVATWNRANALIRTLPEERVRIVAYEDFFGGSEAARRSLLAFIGVEEEPRFREGAAAAYRKYEAVRTTPPLVLEGQEALLAAEADTETYRALLARARAAPPVAPAPRRPPEAPDGIRDLQVGCGPKHLRPNWWNTDLRPFRGLDEAMDAVKPWRWTDLLDHVYAEHFLEHLDLADAVTFLQNAGRALRVGGHIRLSTPGLEWVMSSHFRFAEPDRHDQILDTLRTNRAFHGWGHQFLYSQGMLRWLLEGMSYDNVRFCSYGESDLPVFRGIEMHGKLRVANNYPSVWIVEATRGGRPIVPTPAMLELMQTEFLRQVRGRH